MISRAAFVFTVAAAIAVRAQQPASPEVSDADKRIVQTVQRLSSFDYSKTSAKTREAIDRYLLATAGSDEYFQLVEKYGIASQRDTLIKLAQEKPGLPAAGQAIKLLFQLGQGSGVKDALATMAPEPAAAFVQAIAGVGSKETTELAAAVMNDSQSPPATADGALRGLALNTAGQHAILAAAKAGTLPESLKAQAATLLATSTDEAVRNEAAAAFATAAVKPMPVIADLAKKTGDVEKGGVVYMTYCFSCHQVNGLGVDFGPGLSEIGSKLAKEALYDAILNPSAGVSFGFEGWEVKTKDGNTYVGMIASETDAEVALKVPGGVVIKCGKGDIVSRGKLKASLMTPNLHTVMTDEDLVNLVEYLTTLKKKP